MDELFLSVLNMSLTASYVIVVVILLRLPLKKAPKMISYALWAVVAFRLICPFSFESAFSLLPAGSQPVPQDIIYQQNPQIDSGINSIDAVVNDSLPPADVAASVNPLQIITRIGSWVWILGAIFILVYVVVSGMILKRRLLKAKRVEKNIYEASNLRTPFVLGILRPKIYIPAGLTAEEKSYIIRHEQTHISRFDHVIKLFASIVLSIHWFNPLAWVAFALMNTDMELSCDEKVIDEMGVGIKKAYSASLLSLASGRRLLNGSPLAFGEGNVKGRIKNVLNYQKPSFWIIVFAVIGVIVVSIGLLANPKGDGGWFVSIGGREETPSGVNHLEPDKTEPEAVDSSESISSPSGNGIPDGEISVSYDLIYSRNGEILGALSPLQGDDAKLAEDTIMNYMIKSAAWPGMDIDSLEEYYALHATYSDGTSTDYYAYILNGRAVMQYGEDGFYSFIDEDLYEKLVTLAQSRMSMAGVENTTADTSPSEDLTDLETAISQAILSSNAGQYKSGDIATEAHTILKTEESEDTTTVYAMALYLEFSYTEDGISETSGSHMPVAITFERSPTGGYDVIEYWMPQEGTHYGPSIQEKFPADINADALDTQKYITAHMQSCYAQAVEYGKIVVYQVIAGLIETITSSPLHMSNPQAYIQEHTVEYREMIYYGGYTLQYCFTLFEQGGQTGLDGHIMAAACRDILGEAEALDILADTGQDWYDAFKLHTENLREENGDDYMKENYPGSYLLMQMLDSANG